MAATKKRRATANPRAKPRKAPATKARKRASPPVRAPKRPTPRASTAVRVPTRPTPRASTPTRAPKRSKPIARASPPRTRSRRPSAKRFQFGRAQQLVAAIAVAVLIVPVILLNRTDAEAIASSDMEFGMDMNSIQAQTRAGVKPDYATIWVGPWTLKSGWSSVNASLDKAVAADVTPVIHFYYWGDDISISCVERGCWSDLHDAQKDRAGWDRLANGLASSIQAHAKGKRVVIILETEFNKGNIQTYEAFDGYLASKAQFFHKRNPAADVVLGFGNWNPENCKNFDRAAAASDYVGIQAMRGSTRDTVAGYHDVVDATLTAVKRLSKTFDRPVFLTDLALSSYPETTYESRQAAVLSSFFARLSEFQAAGLHAVIYRTWTDNPNMDTQNHFGQAERHWGLYEADGSAKPAAKVWINGVKASRAGPAN